MTIEGLAKSLDTSLGPKGKMLKEEFLVMVTLTSFYHLTPNLGRRVHWHHHVPSHGLCSSAYSQPA
jgi:hypothetical protein